MDFHVLVLLFSLMSAVCGLQKSGIFEYLSSHLLKSTKTSKGLCFILVSFTFFLSMVVTNDVALIIIVPFTINALSKTSVPRSFKIKTIVLETIAANLGSMTTPFGNPQNLFLYSHYSFGAKDFFLSVLPYAAVSFLLLWLFTLLGKSEKITAPNKSFQKTDKERLILYSALLIVCILSVVRIIHFALAGMVTLCILIIKDKEILRKNDYCLLLTFVCFFVFSGNLGRIDAVNTFLKDVLEKSTLITSLLTSQIISNVPSAVLLAPFTSSREALLAGVNIGGLGTPVASLASLISLKLYMKSKDASVGFYLTMFTVYNLIALGILMIFAVCWLN